MAQKNCIHSLFHAVGDCREQLLRSAAPGEFAAAFVFPPEFLGFAGHFPGNPILPGIAQIMAVLHACGAKAPAALLAVASCKFLRPVTPGERVFVDGERTACEEGVAIAATVRTSDAVCAAMRLVVKPETEDFPS